MVPPLTYGANDGLVGASIETSQVTDSRKDSVSNQLNLWQTPLEQFLEYLQPGKRHEIGAPAIRNSMCSAPLAGAGH